ncbi:hypothetical protein [Streptomyces sp. NBC_00211]|uniref:hypothetical protein n=1 Tax=Streptomyces sp. NBC_00211 TaxID=2975683 RepID=UPI00324D4C59
MPVAQIGDGNQTAACKDLVPDTQFGGRHVHRDLPRGDLHPIPVPDCRAGGCGSLACDGAGDPLEPGRIREAHHQREG